jgi:hypothetical protein
MNALPAAIAAALLLLLVAFAGAWPGRDADEPATEGLSLWGGLRGLPETGTLVVDGPVRGYTLAEVEQLRSFLQGGGRMLVIEPTAPAISLLEALDVGVTASPGLVFDPDRDVRDRFTVTPTGELGLERTQALSASQVVEGAGRAVLLTGPFVWHDLDADGEPDLDEPRGTFSVARVQDVGDGAVLVLGSRALLEPGPSSAVLQAWATEVAPTVHDRAHGNAPDALDAGSLLAGHRPRTIAWGLGALALVAAAVALGVRIQRVGAARRRRGPVDRQTLELLAELGE